MKYRTSKYIFDNDESFDFKKPVDEWTSIWYYGICPAGRVAAIQSPTQASKLS